MKKLLCFALALALIFSLSACAGRTPAFSADEMTDAQSFAAAAMESCPVKTGYELKNAEVMLTSDFAGDMSKSVALEKWDLSQVAAAVVLTLGPVSADAPAETEAPADNVVFFLLNAKKEIVFSHISGASTGTKDAEAPEATDYAALLAELYDEYGTDEFSAATLRRTLARLELDQEDFIAGLGESDAAQVSAVQSAMAEDTEYFYSKKYLMAVSQKKCLQTFDEYERERQRLDNRVNVLAESDGFADEEKYEVYERLIAKEFYNKCRLALGQQIAAAQTAQDSCYAANASTLDPRLEKAKYMAEKDEDYLYSEEYLALCVGSDAMDSYDTCSRKIALCQSALEQLSGIYSETDADARGYLLERAVESSKGLVSYVEALKDAEKTKLAYDGYVADNKAALDACDKAIEELHEEFGDDLSENLDYIKLEMKYSEQLDKRASLESSAGDAQVLAQTAYSNWQDSLQSIDTREQARKDGLTSTDEQAALTKYFESATLDSVFEYEAQSGQWGYLHSDYILWQNAHLRRPVTYAGSSTKKDDLDADIYDMSGNYFSVHDTDGDGTINSKELRAALTEYVNWLNTVFKVN